MHRRHAIALAGFATIFFIVGTAAAAPATADTARAEIQIASAEATPAIGHGQREQWNIVVENTGSATTTTPVTISLAYDQYDYPTLPGHPQAFGSLAAIATGKHTCNNDQATRIASCTVQPIEPGGEASMSVVGTAELGTSADNRIQWTASVPNYAGSTSTYIGTESAEILTSPATGHYDVARLESTNIIQVSGWAYDKIAKGHTMAVYAFLDSDSVGSVTKFIYRPDVDRFLHTTGNYGFQGDLTVGAQRGDVAVCLVAQTESDVYQLGCKTVVVPAD